jgi:hypothetical protein
MPVIPVTWEVEAGGSRVCGWPGQSYQGPISKKKKQKEWEGGSGSRMLI